MNPDEWGKTRIYPPSSGVPGPRDPNLTPYMIPWARATASGEWTMTAITCGAQMGKTDTQLDMIGERLDTRAAPILYVGPSKEFNTDQFEPRVEELLKQSRSLGSKVTKGKRQKKTLKWIAGVRLRLAHAGSSTALKSDPASLAMIDEFDEMSRGVRGQGNVLGLVTARGFTFADFVTCVASTPSKGLVDSEMDMASGLELWKKVPPEDLESPQWKLWQSGTMHHWAVPCPHCDEYFIPRLKLLRYPEGGSVNRARRETYLECPNRNCAKPIYDEGEYPDGTKFRMNARGLAVARGQWIENGVVCGEPGEDTTTYSLWVSALMSPFVRWGERAEEIVKAANSGDPNDMQTAVNAGGGELYAPGGGEVPEWKEVLKLKRPYKCEEVPDKAILLTCGVDVQKNSLVYVVRAWGARATSWLVAHGELYGPTTHPDVWDALDDLLSQRFGNHLIKVCFIDSGFRPGKPHLIPENMVYEFCRRHSRFCFPTKGHDVQMTPIRRSKIEVNPLGGAAKYGLELFHLDSDYFKGWVHERIRWPVEQPGAWYLHEGADEAYARQIVSEARLKGPSGKPVWVRRSRDNHFLDCEALAAAAGYFLNVHRISPKAVPEPAEIEETKELEHVGDVATVKGEVKNASPPAKSEPEAKGNKFAKMAARMNMMRK